MTKHPSSLGVGPAPPAIPAREIFVLSACAGLLVGVMEGAGLLLLQRLGWLSWERLELHVTLEIVAISAAFDFVLFGLGGLAWALASVFLRRLQDARFVVGVLAALAFFDWLSLPGYMQDIGTLSIAVGLSIVLVRRLAGRWPAALSLVRKSAPLVFAGGMLAIVGIPCGLWAKQAISLAMLPSAPAGAPNVLIIVLDTLRADHVSAYGYNRTTTPSIDRLSQTGALFETAISTASWSPPSHASLLTGRYPFEHRVEWDRPLDARFLTLPEALRSRGYRTAAASANKWWFHPGQGFDRGFIRFDALYLTRGDAIVRTLYGRLLKRYFRPGLSTNPIPGEEVNRRAFAWIDHQSDHPFFLVLNFMDVHHPAQTPRSFRALFLGPRGEPVLEGDMRRLDQRGYTPKEMEAAVGLYDAATAYADHHVGQLLAGLEKRGLLENTLVVVTSDHGSSLFEHGLVEHRNSLYMAEIRIPLIFRWPKGVPSGVRIARPVSLASIPSTIMDLLGDTSHSFPGPSLAALWRTPDAAAGWPWPFSEMKRLPFLKIKRTPLYHGGIKSLVSPNWHYIVHEKFGQELFEWKTDPREENDRSKSTEGRRLDQVFARRLQEVQSGSDESRQPSRLFETPPQAEEHGTTPPTKSLLASGIRPGPQPRREPRAGRDHKPR